MNSRFQARVHQLIIQNRDLLEHLNQTVHQIQQLEAGQRLGPADRPGSLAVDRNTTSPGSDGFVKDQVSTQNSETIFTERFTQASQQNTEGFTQATHSSITDSEKSATNCLTFHKVQRNKKCINHLCNASLHVWISCQCDFRGNVPCYLLLCNFLRLRSCDCSIGFECVIFCFDLTKPTKFRHRSSISKSPSAPLSCENFSKNTSLLCVPKSRVRSLSPFSKARNEASPSLLRNEDAENGSCG